MKGLLVISAFFVTALTAARASGQAFFGGGVVGFDPEISVVYSGVVMDVQPVVSHDNKYVTIGMQVQDSRVIALHNFQVAGAAAPGAVQGFVGDVAPSSAAAVPLASSPDAIDRRAIATRSVLSRRGMFLLAMN